MKIIKSITTKILLLVFSVLLFMCLTLYLLSSIQLKTIINHSQNELYNEKLDTIINIIEKKYSALINTGLVEAYEEDFKTSLLISLQQTYSKNRSVISPFIFNSVGEVIMYKDFYRGDDSLSEEEFMLSIIQNRISSFNLTDYKGLKNWYITKYFEPWDWIVVYIIPSDIKYQDVFKFQYSLILLMIIITIMAMFILYLFLKLVIKPIPILINASTAMSSGNLDYKISKVSDDELGILTDSFIIMRDSIKSSMKELTKTKSYLDNVINSMPSILIGVDINGNITNMNREAEKIAELSFTEAQGKELSKIFPLYIKNMDEIKESIKNKSILSKENVISQIKDDVKYSNITAYPLITNGIIGTVIRIDDITETVRLHEKMIQSEKMLSIGGLAAGMAHEINNPLAGILQNIQVLENRLTNCSLPANIKVADELSLNLDLVKEYLEKRKILKMIDEIRISGDIAAEIVHNMLFFAKKEIGSKRKASIVDLLERTIEIANNDYNLKKNYDFRTIDIIREYQEGLPEITCEPTKLQQVLLNIMKNGAEAMQDKIPDNYTPKFVLRIYLNNEMLNIEIEDNGPGIKESCLKRIFEPFYTSKSSGKGTGLGMSISYFIITENHGGTLTVESKEDEWTKFVIGLPV